MLEDLKNEHEKVSKNSQYLSYTALGLIDSQAKPPIEKKYAKMDEKFICIQNKIEIGALQDKLRWYKNYSEIIQ